MLLLVSPRDVSEALECLNSGVVDIIDIKNPDEGSLGANYPWIIEEIKEKTGNHRLSTAIGDIKTFQPGTISLAARGVTMLGVDYIKVGVMLPDSEQALQLMQKVVRAVKGYNSSVSVVAAGYADHAEVDGLDVFELPRIGKIAGCDLVMIDTALKNGSSLFDKMSERELKDWSDQARKNGLKTALAGSLKTKHLEQLYRIKPDIIGVRSAVCDSYDRQNGKLRAVHVVKFRKAMESYEVN
ncbi:MAG: (5-formylfuran-3-yl)methyl phosphate synthase [Candidatus Hodarchaeales archaeon]|jgi:uncharacterized protein (UPF0264 family)